MGYEHHVHTRTIVLPEQRVLFLPVPKAGCTSILWTLATIAGYAEDDFAQSIQPEVTPALTIHDMTAWGPKHKFSEYPEDEREEILASDDWLRFTVVRHPVPRLWSAWQSKLLLREPRFLTDFGSEPWFPALPDTPEQLIEDFRRFVAVVGGGLADDVHWSIQDELVSQLPFNFIGSVEGFDKTLEKLREHVGELPEDKHSNRTPLSMPANAYDEAAAEVVRAHYAPDYEAFDYDPDDYLGATEDDAWAERVAPLLPVLRASAEEHQRFEQMLQRTRQYRRRLAKAEQRFEQREVRRVGNARASTLTNREGLQDFNVNWAWADGELDQGFTAVLRVRNEALMLPYSLPGLFAAARRVVLVDNGSTDGTPAVARQVAAEQDAADRLEVLHYPHQVAPCGAQHLATPADSVHSLAYFYNWSFSHVRTTYALKWDGDMVLSDEAIRIIRDLDWQLEAGTAILRIPRHSLYIGEDNDVAYLDLELRNNEPWGWPNRPGWSFVKAMEWELPLWAEKADTFQLPEGSSIELKRLDADEFGHWTDTDFTRSARTRRKAREWSVFQALRDGAKPPKGVIEIRPRAGEDIVAAASAWVAEHAEAVAA